MKKRILAVLLALAMLAMPALAEEQTALQTEEQPEAGQTAPALTASQQRNIIKEFAHTLADNYYYGVSDNNLLYSVICDTIDNGGVFDVDRALAAMVGTLGDQYAEFYEPDSYDEQYQYYEGNFFGIGVILTVKDEGSMIDSVYSGSPAEEAGLKSGDIIVNVGGVDASKLNPSQIRELVSGEEGTPVEITVLRGEEIVKVVAVRRKITESHSTMEVLNGDIAYIDVDSFTGSLPGDFDRYLEEIAAQGLEKVIIDLRDNGGGEFEAAVAVAQKLISAGLIGKIKYRNEAYNENIYSENFNAPRFKLLVLVNENTASASELLSMALQSRGRAKLMGVHTYGKGSMQLVMKSPTGSGLKFTIGEFFSPDDERINTVGLTPDIEVKNEVIPVDVESFAPIDMYNINVPLTKLGVEQRLWALGLLSKSAADGVYDSQTELALNVFQQLCGLEATGMADFNTVLALNDHEYNAKEIVDIQMQRALEYFE